MTESREDSTPSGEKRESDRSSPAGVIGVETPSLRERSSRPPFDPALAAVVVGSAIALVGLIDVALAWLPFQFGEIQWEFGTISRTFDGLPLATLGFGATLAGLSARGAGKVASWLIAIVLAAALAVLLVLAGLYVMNGVAAWGMSGPGVRETLQRAFVRTGLFAGIYLVTYSWMTWMAIRMLRSRGKGRKV